MHTDDLSWYITSNQQGQMFIQNRIRIVSMPNVMPGQILYCTTDCIPIDLMFQKFFRTNTQVWNGLSHRNDCRQRGVIWVTYGCYTATHTRSRTYVIRRSSVPPCALVRPTTNWSQPDTVATSKAATPWRFVVVDPNHSWWWPFKSPTSRGERHAHPQPARQLLMLVNNQKSGHPCQGWLNTY